MGRASAKNGGISSILHTAYRKSFPTNQWYQWRAEYSDRMLFGISTHLMSTTPNGGTPNHKNWNSFHPSCRT